MSACVSRGPISNTSIEDNFEEFNVPAVSLQVTVTLLSEVWTFMAVLVVDVTRVTPRGY